MTGVGDTCAQAQADGTYGTDGTYGAHDTNSPHDTDASVPSHAVDLRHLTDADAAPAGHTGRNPARPDTSSRRPAYTDSPAPARERTGMHDITDRHPDIHWPAGLSPEDAHSFHRAEAVVPGPPERSFRLLTDVASWPDWVPALVEVSTDTFTPTFEVHWQGHPFEVFVGEHEPPYRLGWLGIGAGVRLYQSWLLTEVDDGTLVVVENVVRGSAPKALDTAATTWTGILHGLWLTQLDKMREYPATPPGDT